MKRDLLFTLIVLTALDGSPVLVESRQVQIIRSRSEGCGPGTGAVVAIGSRALCVKETPAEIREKIRDTED